MSTIQDETRDAEGQFLRLIEQHEQKVLSLVNKTSKQDVQTLDCSECGKPVLAAPIYLNTIQCSSCTPPITLESEQLDSLLQDARENLFQQLSELDEAFSEKEHVKLRDAVLKELKSIQTLVEASIDASEAMQSGDEEEEDTLEVKEFDALIKNFTRIRSIERLARVFGISQEVTSDILKTKIGVLFGPKPPKIVGQK